MTALTKDLTAPLSAFMMTCFSGACATRPELLPAHSIISTIASDSEIGSFKDTTRMILALEKLDPTKVKEMNSIDLLYFFLARAISLKWQPSFLVRNTHFNSAEILKSQLGIKFTHEERERINIRLGTIMDPSEIENSIRLIETSTEEFWEIPDVWWGRVLAVSLAASDQTTDAAPLFTRSSAEVCRQVISRLKPKLEK
jgi:NOL1/NOP2/fmu family ribosome biogenesis protein